VSEAREKMPWIKREKNQKKQTAQKNSRYPLKREKKKVLS